MPLARQKLKSECIFCHRNWDTYFSQEIFTGWLEVNLQWYNLAACSLPSGKIEVSLIWRPNFWFSYFILLEEGSYCGFGFKDFSFSFCRLHFLSPFVVVAAASTVLDVQSRFEAFARHGRTSADLKPLPDMAELEAPDFFIGDFLGKDPNEPFFSAFFSSF